MQRFFRVCCAQRHLETNTAPPAKRAPKPFHRILQGQRDPITERICPITLELITTYPPEACVIFIDGHIYHKEALLQWLNHHATVPTSNQSLSEFAQRYRLRILGQQHPRALQLDNQLLWFHVAMYLTLSLLGFGGFMITRENPISNNTTQHAVSSISLSLMFFASAYLVLYLTLRCSKRQPPHEVILPPQLTSAEPPDPLAQVEAYYRAFLLDYDPAYFPALRTATVTLDSPS